VCPSGSGLGVVFAFVCAFEVVFVFAFAVPVAVELWHWTSPRALGYEPFPVPSRKSIANSPPQLERLLEAAASVRERAYAPYSRFKVGAAVLSKSGRIHVGCNVENASYGLTLCAERAAAAAAVAAGDAELTAIAVVTDAGSPAPPCGMCLQTLLELAAPTARVVLKTVRGKRKHYALRELLPHGFGRRFL